MNGVTVLTPDIIQEETKEQVIEKAIKKFNVADADISEMKKNYMALSISGIDDKKGYKAVYDARQIVKGKRILVERKRKELNQDAQEYIKAVNGEAKRITELLEPIELHLENEETRIEQERERLKKEAAEREAARIQDRIDKLHAYGYGVDYAAIKSMTDIEFNDTLGQARVSFEKEQEEKRIAAEKAEQERIEQERLKKEESERLAKERELLEKQRKEQEEKEKALLYEQQILEAEKKAIELQKQKEADEKAAVERKRLQEIEDQKRAEEEKQRALSLRPDKEKLEQLASDLLEISYPDVTDTKAILIIEETKARINNTHTYILKQIETFSVLIAKYDPELQATIIQ